MAGAVLDRPCALILIVQCLQSAPNVMAFLKALPLAKLDASLAALLQLLTRPGPLAYTWPTLRLDDIDCDDDSTVALYHAALPALVSICAKEFKLVERFMRPRGDAITPAQGFLDFASQWPLKMTHVDGRWVEEVGSAAFCSELSRCTRLRSIELSANAAAPAILAAITTSAHCVHTLDIARSSGAPAMNWASLLQPWLSSGHAKHVSFNKVPTTDCNGLAHALATTESLRGLHIVANDDILCDLVEWKLPLHRVTELTLATANTKAMRQLMQLVDVTKLTSLALHCQYEISDVLGLIPRMTSLRHLSLQWVHFGDTDTSQWPDLESVYFGCVKFTPSAFDGVLVYLNNVSGLKQITLHCCSTVGASFAALSRTLGRLINRGLTMARLTDLCLDGYDAALLAFALRQRRSASPLKLDLCSNDFGIDGVRVLLEALAGCTHVGVQIEPTEDEVMTTNLDEIQRFVEAHRMTSGPNDTEGSVIYSPTTTMST
ncbi:hypothetical protein SDRG_08061 [Saprolegnia diclina VS20]|uniref:RNI-like protein n=1 Tax=Saprolegnia diclina (strain VS20) TaxID=1156394 RepID=T0RP96_SAPDV|nr:hypothetical protein SDRG_08061 [Saprolegnia diclina VS20]EQC34288.1 hypothetical protein SDRG_08061 [Saprolegnia diclina VS20]|eukprot:XP_008612150.1 hypothetical protein SDRG_08061 [Saprolegnia diclina VS20]